MKNLKTILIVSLFILSFSLNGFLIYRTTTPQQKNLNNQTQTIEELNTRIDRLENEITTINDKILALGKNDIAIVKALKTQALLNEAFNAAIFNK